MMVACNDDIWFNQFRVQPFSIYRFLFFILSAVLLVFIGIDSPQQTENAQHKMSC